MLTDIDAASAHTMLLQNSTLKFAIFYTDDKLITVLLL